eukprot:347385_1
MKNIIDISFISLAAGLYTLSFFYRGSIAPITDVLEAEFNATSSQIGLMSSSFFFGYFILQIPCGILLQYITSEFIILLSAILFGITSLLFGLPMNTNSRFSSIIMLISGIAIAPVFLAVCSIITQRFGHNYLPYIGGIIFFVTAIFLTSANLLQAYLWHHYKIWREIYYGVSGLIILIFIIFYIINCICNSDNKQQFKIILKKSKKSGYDGYVNHYDDDGDKNHTETLTVGMNELEGKNTDTLLMNNYINQFYLLGISIFKTTDKTESFCYRIHESLKCAFMNPWNYILGLQWFCVTSVMLAFNGLWLISYMSLKFGYTRELSTFISGTFYIAHAFGNVIIGKLSYKYKKRKIFLILCSIFLLSPLYIIYCDKNTSMNMILLMNIIGGIGTGVSAVTFALAREYNEYFECSDIASSIVNTISSTSGFIMPWLVGILIDYNWRYRNDHELNDNNDRIYTETDYDFGFIVI